MHYTRIMGAEHQIDEAIWLFFQGRSPIGSYALIFSAHEVVKNMLSKKKKKSIIDSLQGDQGFLEKVHKNSRNIYNKLKHADNDPESDIGELDFEDIEPCLYFVCKDFFSLTNGYTPAMSIFEAWFIASYPEKIGKGEEDYLKKAQEAFPNVWNVAMAERLKIGLAVLTEYHDKPGLEMPIVREWSSL